MTNRKFYRIALFIIMFCLMMGNLQAKNVVRTVRVGFFSAEGYQQTDAKGNRSGYGYDLLLLLERYSNLKFVYVGQDKNRMETLDMLERGEVDIVTSVHKEPSRLGKFEFSYPIGQSSIIISVRDDDTRFVPYDFSYIETFDVGFSSSYGIYDQVKEFAKDNNFGIVPRYYANNDELERALANKEVDAIATNSLRHRGHEKVIADFSTRNFYAVVRKGDKVLLDEINNAIEQMNESERGWQTTLFNRNYKQDVIDNIEFTPEENAFIKAHANNDNPIVVATDNLWQPFSVKKDGKYIGIIPDYWKKIFDMTGMKYRYYEYKDDIFSLDNLNNGNADIYIGTSYTPQEAEHRNLLVSPPFMNVGASLLYRRTNAEIHTVAICGITSFLNQQFLRLKGYRTRTYLNSDEAAEALENGDVDAVCCYTFDAQRLVNNDPDGSLIYRVVPGINIDLRAVISLDSDHILLSIVSKCIKRLQGVQTETIVSKNLAHPVTEFRLSDWISVHRYISTLIFIIIAMLCLAVLNLVIRFKIREQVNRKQKQQLDEISRLNEELKNHQVKLEAATKAAEDANRAKTSFLFNMSHDIRTPMNAIMGFRELLEKHQEDPVKRADYLKKIDDSSHVLLSIINNVLEMARIEKGSIEIEETAWSAEQFNETLYSIFQDMMKQKSITFTRQIEVKNNYVFCDALKLREIFINILSNAYKYTNTGGKVNMRLEEIPCDREGYVLYQTTISDTGIGMSEEFLPHIFDEFARESNTTETKIEGTGLGMPIVRRLVEMLDGKIEVKSKKGVGSSFIVTIPHRIAERTNLADHAGVELDPKLFENKRILLAEDNDLNAEIAIELLSEVGFKIERAEDGKICCDMLEKALPDYYDVILMDIQMPNMNGYEATRTIRAMRDSSKATIPILAMTANAFEEDKREAIRSGMDGHLGKPINISILMKELARVLS